MSGAFLASHTYFPHAHLLIDFYMHTNVHVYMQCGLYSHWTINFVLFWTAKKLAG